MYAAELYRRPSRIAISPCPLIMRGDGLGLVRGGCVVREIRGETPGGKRVS